MAALHPSGFRQAAFFLFGERVSIAPYPPCAEIFAGIPYPPDPAVVPAGTEENYYQIYFALAALLRPATYLEIGTRFGYSTVAVARGAPSLQRIVSCDLQAYGNPYGVPSQSVAERNLRASGYGGEAMFIAADSRDLTKHIGGETFDLILVDGDHSYEGCSADIRLCRELLHPKGVMLIDDADQPEVCRAALDSIRDLGVDSRDHDFVPTKHGLFLLRRP
jgi:predicted O-methyltransferase YrrM